MRYYLCGPDDTDDRRRAARFASAESSLRALGLDVVSPYTSGLHDGDLAEGLEADARALRSADAVIALPGTPANQYELAMAGFAGKNVYALDDVSAPALLVM